jgi:hypothetical protein
MIGQHELLSELDHGIRSITKAIIESKNAIFRKDITALLLLTCPILDPYFLADIVELKVDSASLLRAE